MSLTTWSAIASAGHFLGIFGLVAGLSVQLTLLSPVNGPDDIRRFLRAGRAAGLSAAVLILMGLARVIWFEKGMDFYLGNVFFWLKMLCLLIGIILSLQTGRLFDLVVGSRATDAEVQIASNQLQRLKRLIHWQLVVMGLMVVLAVWMARGIGMI